MVLEEVFAVGDVEGALSVGVRFLLLDEIVGEEDEDVEVLFFGSSSCFLEDAVIPDLMSLPRRKCLRFPDSVTGRESDFIRLKIKADVSVLVVDVPLCVPFETAVELLLLAMDAGCWSTRPFVTFT